MQLYLRQPFWRWDNCGNILSPLDVPIMLPKLLNYPSRFGQDELVAWFHFWDSKKQGLSVLLLISHQQNLCEVFSTPPAISTCQPLVIPYRIAGDSVRRDTCHIENPSWKLQLPGGRPSSLKRKRYNHLPTIQPSLHFFFGCAICFSSFQGGKVRKYFHVRRDRWSVESWCLSYSCSLLSGLVEPGFVDVPTLTLAVVTTFHTALAKSADAPTKAWGLGGGRWCQGEVKPKSFFFQGQKATPQKNG